MKRLIIPLVASLSLAGCGTFLGDKKEQLVVKPEIVEKPKLEVPQPQPVQQLAVEWVIITKENYEQKFKEIEARGGVVTLFALTPQGYQNLSMNVSELRRFIQQQNAVIGAMKNYYEPKPKEEPKK